MQDRDGINVTSHRDDESGYVIEQRAQAIQLVIRDPIVWRAREATSVK